MKCPVCDKGDLLLSVQQGVEIDYCPQCRGVWLDRGELEKIMERAIGPAKSIPRGFSAKTEEAAVVAR
ncbi:MAG: zf-TFIIB domain-containing protein [Thermodesulfobacteriota bacterium]